MNAIILANAFCCWFMTGVIWLVQLLIYPNFKLIPREILDSFHSAHSQRISWIVGPVMTLELISAGCLTCSMTSTFNIWNLVSVVTLWGLTAFVSVPLHNRLAVSPASSIRQLIATNWPRTILWSLRSLSWLIFLQGPITQGAS